VPATDVAVPAQIRPHRLPHRVRPYRAGGRLPLLLVVPSLVTAVVAVVPLVYLGIRTAQAGASEVADVLFQRSTGELVLRSLTMALVVTVACTALGVAVAWLVVRTDMPGHGFFGVVAALPLAVPTYVAGYAWISALPRFSGFPAAATVLTLCSYPYVYLPVAAALRRLDPAAEEASRSLGAGPGRTFLRVSLRQLRPAIASGALLVALYVLSDFGAVSLLRFDSFTRVIFTAFNLGFDRTTALVLATVLIAITAAIVLAEGLSRGRARYARVGSGTARAARRVRLGATKAPAVAFLLALAALALGVPAGSLGYWMARGASRPTSLADVGAAAGASLWVSLLGALLTIVLAVPVGLLAGRHRGPVPFVLERATWLSHALPGLVIGLSLVFLGINVATELYQTTAMLALAYAVLFLPLAVGAVRSAAVQSPPALEDVAKSTGRGSLHVLATITLPLTGPGIGVAAVLTFLTCMKELPATLLLRPTGLDTLATELWTYTGVAAYGAAAPYAALLVLLSAVPTYLLGRRWGAIGATGGAR